MSLSNRIHHFFKCINFKIIIKFIIPFGKILSFFLKRALSYSHDKLQILLMVTLYGMVRVF